MKDSINLIRSYHTFNFIKNLKEKINTIENAKINKEYLAFIEKKFSSEDVLDEIVVALLNYLWPTEQDRNRNFNLKKFIKHVLKFSNATISIYISAIYYLLNLKDNCRFNNLLQRIQLEIENTKQEQGFINNGNLHERCCASCGAYISCYRSETVVCKCRLFLTSLILASKFGQDKNYSNKAWSKISRFSVENINYNERFFLNLVDYKLYIKLEEYQAFASQITSHIVSIENQKKKMKCQELMNLTKMSVFDISNAQERKKYLEKKTLMYKKLKQLQAIKQAKLKFMKRQTVQINTFPANIQKLSPVEEVHNNMTDLSGDIENTIQKFSPVDQYSSSGMKVDDTVVNNTNVNYKPSDIAAISPISPSGLPIASINPNNNVNYIPEQQQQLPICSYSITANESKEVKVDNVKSNQLTVENFSSFIHFYNCINNKFSTSSESVIKSTYSYKILNYVISLACSKRVGDALSILNHIIYGTMDICKEILSLALKGHVKTALIYIYLLTPNEIKFYNSNIKTPSLKALTPEDVLSVVSILLNCVQKNSTQPTEIKNDLLANLGHQNQINISSSQNLLLTFIKNINCSLSHN